MLECGYGCYWQFAMGGQCFCFRSRDYSLHGGCFNSDSSKLRGDKVTMLMAECQLHNSIVLLVAVDFVEKRCEQTPLIW